MLKSMTAFGRATSDSPIGPIGVEILSVNRKHLEMQLQIPRFLNCLDKDIRGWVSSKVHRGQISIRITPHFEKKSPVKVTPNMPLAKEVAKAWKEIASEVGGTFDLRLLVGESGILLHEDDIDTDVVKSALEKAVSDALKPFIAMKTEEGKALEKDILSRLAALAKWIKEVEKFAPAATEKMQQKLRDAVEKVVPGAIENEERLLREICLYAEKFDIAEELTRFESHLGQMREIISREGEAVGKTLEFILQELGREINTIGSKSSDLEVAKLVIEIKAELERIKEQVQNVE